MIGGLLFLCRRPKKERKSFCSPEECEQADKQQVQIRNNQNRLEKRSLEERQVDRPRKVLSKDCYANAGAVARRQERIMFMAFVVSSRTRKLEVEPRESRSRNQKVSLIL